MSKFILNLSDNYEAADLFKAYYLRGKLHYLLNDFKTALINLNNAQLLNESSNKVYIMNAMCYVSVGNIKKAKEEIESVSNESL